MHVSRRYAHFQAHVKLLGGPCVLSSSCGLNHTRSSWSSFESDRTWRCPDDFLCVHRWVDSLAWDGAAEWALTSEEPWQSDGKVAGSVRSSGPLTFLKVARAVSADQGLRLYTAAALC